MSGNTAQDGPQRIGTRNEWALHAALKAYLARPNGQIEAQVAGYQIDVLHHDADGPLLIEVQTGHFASIRDKLHALLDADYRVLLVYPVAQARWLVDLSADGTELLRRRKSPRHGRAEDLFRELVAFPTLVHHPGLQIELLLIHDEEVRHDDGNGSWRRRGRSIADRRLLQVVDRRRFPDAESLARLLPGSLPESFTTAQIARAAHISAPLAGKMAYCLREMGVIQQVGKQGRAYLYQRS